MGKILVIGEESLFQKIDALKSNCSLNIQIDHKERIIGNLPNKIKKDESSMVLIFLDMKVSLDEGSPISFVKIWPMVGPFFWTRSVICPWPFRQSS